MGLFFLMKFNFDVDNGYGSDVWSYYRLCLIVVELNWG